MSDDLNAGSTAHVLVSPKPRTVMAFCGTHPERPIPIHNGVDFQLSLAPPFSGGSRGQPPPNPRGPPLFFCFGQQPRGRGLVPLPLNPFGLYSFGRFVHPARKSTADSPSD